MKYLCAIFVFSAFFATTANNMAPALAPDIDAQASVAHPQCVTDVTTEQTTDDDDVASNIFEASSNCPDFDAVEYEKID